MSNIFQDLTNIIDDLWIAKRSKLKLRAAIQDLESLLSRLQDENIDLKLSITSLQDEITLNKYHSCLSELMRQTVSVDQERV